MLNKDGKQKNKKGKHKFCKICQIPKKLKTKFFFLRKKGTID